MFQALSGFVVENLIKKSWFCHLVSMIEKRLIKPRIVLLISVFILLTGASVAYSSELNESAVVNLSIPAGQLNEALSQFTKQTGIKIAFDPQQFQGKVVQALSGEFTIKDAINRLISGNKLSAVPIGSGYTLLEMADSPVSNPVVTTLPSIQITASKTASGYLATSSVTATKTNTLLRDVPQSISVITEGIIKDQSIRSLGDAVRYIPGVGVSQGEGNRDALVFRGNRSTADFFVDGIRDDAEYYRDLYNIERVEVLKGPNGMIFGRGGSGGVINRVTKQAGWDPIREFTFQGGSYNLKRMTADVNHAINEHVAFRVNGVFEDAGSFRDGVESQRLGISPTVTIKPTDRTKLVINMERYHDERTADRGITSFGSDGLTPGRPVDVKPSLFFGDPRRNNSNVEVLAFNSLIEHKFESGLILQNRTNYTNYDKFYQNIFPSSPATNGFLTLGAYNNSTERENIFNQTNLIYALDTWKISHTLVAGIEVGQQITHNQRRTGIFDSDSAIRRGLALPVFLSNPTTDTPVIFETRNGGEVDALNRSKVNITSFYLQDQIELLPQLQAIAGVRYDLFEVDFQQRNGNKDHLTPTDGLLSPRFGLIYKPIEPISIYSSFSQSFVPRSGDQLTSLTVTTEVLKPEKFTNLEVGVKWDIRQDLAFTAAAYRLDRTNVILAQSIANGQTLLVKGQRTEGVEVGLNGRLLPNWSVMGGYAYQVGEIVSDQVGAQKGNSVAELPRNTFSVWSRYDLTPKFGAAIGVIYRSSMFASVSNGVVVPDFTRVDAALFAQLTKQVRAQLNVENLFDVKYFASVHNDINITPGSPIAVRASLIANF